MHRWTAEASVKEANLGGRGQWHRRTLSLRGVHSVRSQRRGDRVYRSC